MNRNQRIVRVSVIGILANVLLAAFKAVVGLMAGAIAIVMDAVNNLSDALSSVITIVGTKLSERPADQKHPFGHGRVEYFSAIVISLIVIIVAIAVKLVLGTFVKREGKALKSDALIASGADALFDAIVTLATLISAGIMLIWKVNLDGIFGTLISLVIIKAGVEMLSSPVGELLGSRISPEFVTKLKETALSFKEVHGVYDIIVNNYGPNVMIGSLHVCVPDTLTAREIHLLTRTISETFYKEYGIIMTVGIYAEYMGDTPMAQLQNAVYKVANEHEGVMQVHAFYYYDDRNTATIDIVPDDTVKDDRAFAATMKDYLHEKFPEHNFNIVVDHNYS